MLHRSIKNPATIFPIRILLHPRRQGAAAWHCRTAALLFFLVGERGSRPCRRPPFSRPTPLHCQTPRNLRCFVALHFFRSCGSRWVNMAPQKPQKGRKPNIAPRWPNMACKLGPHSPKMGPHSPKMGQQHIAPRWANLAPRRANIAPKLVQEGPT